MSPCHWGPFYLICTRNRVARLAHHRHSNSHKPIVQYTIRHLFVNQGYRRGGDIFPILCPLRAAPISCPHRGDGRRETGRLPLALWDRGQGGAGCPLALEWERGHDLMSFWTGCSWNYYYCLCWYDDGCVCYCCVSCALAWAYLHQFLLRFGLFRPLSYPE